MSRRITIKGSDYKSIPRIGLEASLVASLVHCVSHRHVPRPLPMPLTSPVVLTGPQSTPAATLDELILLLQVFTAVSPPTPRPNIKDVTRDIVMAMNQVRLRAIDVQFMCNSC